jgi:sortase A
MSRKTRDKILITLGILLILIATAIYASYEYRDRKAGEYSQELLKDFFEDKTSDIKHDSAKGEMPQATYRGYPVIGIIKVPKANIQLPVLSEWSYDLLNISPCRYSGSIEGRDLIILGHNYNSHFTPLKNCVVGDKVEFFDVNNVTYKYRIDKIEQLYKTELDRLTSSDYDLTIFTCTYGGQSRFVARCTLVSEQ